MYFCKENMKIAVGMTLALSNYVDTTRRKLDRAYKAVVDGFEILGVYFYKCSIEEARQMWEEKEVIRRSLLKQLPKEILDTVEDEEAFFLGKMSKETKKLLIEYKEKNLD